VLNDDLDRAKNVYSIARSRVHKALQHAYRGRKEKKRDMRALWIQRINAGTREHGVSPACCLLRVCTSACLFVRVRACARAFA